MNTHIISPKAHGLIDYALVGSLLALPALFRFSKPVKRLYAAEAVGLLGYVALTKHPVALKPVIPFRTHGRIDPFNVAQFALQTFTDPFRRDARARKFNLCFTAIAGAVVALTHWKGRTRRYR